MKKVLCFLLIAAVLTGCSPPIRETMIFESFELLSSDVYDFNMKIDGIGGSISITRQGDNFYVNAFDNETLVLGANMMYTFDHVNEIIFYTEITRERFETILSSYNRPDRSMIDLNGAKLTDTGKAEFRGETLIFEEVRASNGVLSRAFFDGDTIVGLSQVGTQGQWVDMTFYISPNIPEDAFELPQGYTLERG
jgi:hypothetical protein